MSSCGQHINSVPEELKPIVGIVRPYRTLDPVAELYILISRYLAVPWSIFAPTTQPSAVANRDRPELRTASSTLWLIAVST
jgi:hypothetical protein